MVHFSPSSTAPVDKRTFLPGLLYKIQVQREGEKHVNKDALLHISFAQLESWIQKKLFSFW